MSLKELDTKILKLMQLNARISLSEIADSVGASLPTVSDHVKKMEEKGVIKRYETVVNPAECGVDITAFILVSIDSPTHYESFRQHCRSDDRILECHAITGEASHLLKVRVENTLALERLLSELQRWKGVTKTITNLVLSTHKETLSILLTQTKDPE